MQSPSVARMYDYYLGGKDNLAADRQAAEEVLARAPSIRAAARDNRKFMARAVRYCARAGVRQFVDFGTGIPTYPNVCDMVREVDSDAVAVGVDNDAHVLIHNMALLSGVPIIEGDIRDPERIIADPDLQRHITWSEPVALLFVAVLHFVSDAEHPTEIVKAFTDRAAPGSMLVISHVCSTGADPHEVEAVESLYQKATSRGAFRTKEEIRALFNGWDLVDPGLTDIQEWPITAGPKTAIPVLGGVARKSRGD